MSTQNKNAGLMKKEEVLSQVTQRIEEIQKGGFKLPGNYSAENALQSAWLMLQEIQTRDKRPVLDACNKSSIGMALFKMVQLGLNPAKKQCYFIPYGNSLQLMTSYFGNVAIAKRAGALDVKPNVIREGDTFEFETKTDGRKEVKKHIQPFSGMDNEIIGAYCIVVNQDGVPDTDIMTIKQIQQSWQQSSSKGKSDTHSRFTEEMVKRTVTNRAVKMFINSSDDAYLFIDDEPNQTTTEAYVEHEIESKSNKELIGFEEEAETEEPIQDAEVIEDPEPKESETDMPEWVEG